MVDILIKREQTRLRGIRFRANHPRYYKEQYQRMKKLHPERNAKYNERRKIYRRNRYKDDIEYRDRERARLLLITKARIHSNRATNQISAEDITNLYRKFNNQCNNCGTTFNLSIDHIVAVKNGGTNEFSNLQILCMPCNRSKGVK